MRKELWDEMVISFGTRIMNQKEEIEKRLNVTIDSLLYAGTIGDNPLCILNRTFKEIL